MKKNTLTEMKKRKRNKYKRIKEKLGCKFIRINPDENDYDEYVKFGEINNHVSKSNKESTRKATKNH